MDLWGQEQDDVLDQATISTIVSLVPSHTLLRIIAEQEEHSDVGSRVLSLWKMEE